MNMKKLCLIFLFFGFLSCSDDDNILTEGEVNAQKLSEMLNERTINSIWVTWTYGDIRETRSYSNPDYAIEGAFLQIGVDYFNLAKLKKITGRETSVDLYFE